MLNPDEWEYEISIEDDCDTDHRDALKDCDQEAVDWVTKQIESGNLWAWCVVEVSATHPRLPFIEGHAYRGGCSYEDEDAFAKGGYLPRLQEEARDDALREAQDVIEHGRTLASALGADGLARAALNLAQAVQPRIYIRDDNGVCWMMCPACGFRWQRGLDPAHRSGCALVAFQEASSG